MVLGVIDGGLLPVLPLAHLLRYGMSYLNHVYYPYPTPWHHKEQLPNDYPLKLRSGHPCRLLPGLVVSAVSFLGA